MMYLHNDKELVKELFPIVREHRMEIGDKIAPSANINISIKQIYDEIIKNEFYKNDYNQVTLRLVMNQIPYEEVINRIAEIVNDLLKH